MKCPNTSHPDWKKLVELIGEHATWAAYIRNNEEIPNPDDYLNNINYNLRVIAALNSDKVREPAKNIEGFFNDLRKLGVPDIQLNLIQSIPGYAKLTKEELKQELAITYIKPVSIAASTRDLYTITEIDWDTTTRKQYKKPLFAIIDAWDHRGILKKFKTREQAEKFIAKQTTKQFKTKLFEYANIEGGINYEEVIINTPDVIPSIRAVADFATANTIGWIRTDTDRFNTRTRRVLELQSTLFQDGRSKGITGDTETGTDFLNIVGKNNDWIALFIKSFANDSIKKGYTKLKFPGGDAAGVIQFKPTPVPAIVNFYEKTLKSILDRLYPGKVKTVFQTVNDKQYNWHEVDLDAEQNQILLDLPDFVDDILIPGFTAYTQNEVVNHLTEQVLIAIQDTPGIPFNKIISDQVLWMEDQILAGVDKWEPIIENIDRFRLLVQDKLNRLGLLDKAFIDPNTEVVVNGDTVSDSFYWEDDWVFKFDAKANAQRKVKEFLLFIPKTVYKDGQYHDTENYLGTVSYMPFDEVFEDLKALLADSPNTWTDMRRVLEANQESKPWIYNMLYQIDSYQGDINQLINQFVTTFSSTYSASKTVLWDDNQGQRTFKIIDTDQNATKKLLTNNWQNNFNALGFIVDDEPNKDKVAKAIADIDELRNNQQDLTPTLASIGINISRQTATDLIEGKVGNLSFIQHFTARNGLFSIIKNRLSGKDAVGLDIGETVNPVINNSAIRVLAAVEVNNNPQVYSNSYINGEGNLVYSYAFHKYITKQFARLKDPNYVKNLGALSFQATITDQGTVLYKNWIHELANNPEFAQYFEITPFDTIKQSGTNAGTRLSSMSDIDLELTKWSLFQNKGRSVRGVGRLANYLFTIPAKTTSYIITANALDPNLSFRGTDFKIGKASRDALYSIVLSELKRINSIAGKKITVNKYKAGAKYFYVFPGLNDIAELWNSDGTAKLPTTIIEEQNRTVESIIREHIEGVIKQEIIDKVAYWKTIGFANEAGPLYVDREYKSSIKESGENSNTIAAADYIINTTLAEFNMHQVFIGDPAIYFKSNVEATWDEIGKRLAAQIAPGRDLSLSTQNENFISIKVADKEGNFAVNIKQLQERLKEAARPYEEITGTDAQEYTTTKERLYVLYHTGQIDTDQYTRALDKYNKEEDFTPEELNIIFQPDKPVYVETQILNDQDVLSLEYIKSSSIPLLPQFTKGLEIDKVRRGMEKLEKEQGLPVRLAYKSATKVGGVPFMEIFDEKGAIKDNLDFSKNYNILPRTGFRIQQDVPYDPNYEQVVKSTQATKLLFDSILNTEGFNYQGQTYKGKDLLSVWNQLHKDLFEITKAQLHKELLANNGKLSITKVQELLLNEAEARAYSPAELASLQLAPDGTSFEYPFWAITASKKYESILTSLYTNNVVKQKLHGSSFVLTSEEGLIGKSEGVVYTDSYDPTVGLQPMRIEDGIVKPAQVLLPWRFKDSQGNIVDINNYTVNGIIDINKIAEKALTQFAFRIPNQGHNSMALIEVVGFLPEVLGDAVVAPRNFVTQMGSDFDVDKLYIYDYYLYEKDGKLGVETKDTVKNIKNNLLDIHKTVLQNPEVFNQVVAPLGLGLLKYKNEDGKDVGVAVELKKTYKRKIANYFSPDYKKAKYLESVDGKAMVGMESLSSTLNSIIQPHGMYIQKTIEQGKKKVVVPDAIVFGDDNGKTISLGNLSIPTTWRGRLKNSIISAGQSAAVDNEKDPILSYINSNPITYPAISAMRQVGFEEDHIYFLTSQPIIRKFVDRVRSYRSSISTEFIPTAVVFDQMAEEAMDTYIQTLNEGEANDSVFIDIEYYPLTIAELKKNLTKFDPLMDLRILMKFEHAYHYGESLATIQRSINIESSGIGKTVLEVSLKSNQVNRLTDIKNIANVAKVVGEFGEKGLEPNTYSGYLLKNSLLAANNVLGDSSSDLFKYNSRIVKTILKEYEDITRSQANLDRYTDIWDNLKSYIYANTLNTGERKDLFFGSNSLARRIKKYSTTKEGAKNPFILRLSFEISTNSRQPDFVTYAAAKEEFVEEINVYQGLSEIINNSDPDVRKIGEDLITYFYINGGIQKAREWGRYIHPSFLKSYKNGSLLDGLKIYNFNEEERLGDKTIVSKFTQEYFQHKPYLLPKMDNIDVKAVKRIDENTISVAITAQTILNADGSDLVPIFAIADPKADKGLRIYKLMYPSADGRRVYSRIPVLGKTNFVEYGAAGSQSLVNKNYIVPKASIAPVKNKPIDDTKAVVSDSLENYLGTIDSALNKVKFDTKWRSLVEVLKQARYLDKNGNPIKVKLDTGVRAQGVYNFVIEEIKLNPNRSSDIQKTFLHETVHAATYNYLRATTGLTAAQRSAVKNLKDMVDGIRKRVLNGELENVGMYASELKEFETLFATKGLPTDSVEFKRLIELRHKYYGIASKGGEVLYDEFLAELFSNIKFQEQLNKIKYDGKKTVLDRIIEFINRILTGFNAVPGSVLEAGLHEAIILISDGGDVQSVDPNSYDHIVKMRDELQDLYDIDETVPKNYKAVINEFSSRIKFIDQSISKAIIAKDNLKAQQLTNRKEEVQKELKEFEDNQIFDSIIKLANNDLDRVEKIFNAGGLSHNDINYTLRIIAMWKDATDLVLTEEEIVDNTADAQKLAGVVGRANALYNRHNIIARNSLLAAVQDETGLDNVTKEVLQAQEKVNALTANLLDISRTGNILLSVTDKWMREANHKANLEAKDIQDKNEELIKNLYSNELFKKEGYYLFAQTDKNEELTGDLVRPLSADYYQARNTELEKALNETNKQKRKAAWNNYYNWIRNNHNIVDVRKLFTVDTDGKYIYKPDAQYLNTLKSTFGEEFDNIIEEQKKEIKAFNDRLELKETSLQGDPAAAFELQRWRLRYDPVIYLRNVLDNDFQHSYVGGNFVKNEGQEFVVKRAKNNWLDSKYRVIASDPDLKSFHDFAFKTLNNLYKFIPPSFKNGITPGSIPSIPKTITEIYNEEGMGAAVAQANSEFIDALTVGDVEAEANKVKDPLNKKPEQVLKVRYLHNLSPEEKSYDLGKVINLFAKEALAFKHKSTVEDGIKLTYSILEQSLETVRSPRGNAMRDRFGEVLKVKDGRNLMDQFEYAVDSFYGNRKVVQGVTNKKLYKNKAKKKVTLVREAMKSGNWTPEAINVIRIDLSEAEIADTIENGETLDTSTVTQLDLALEGFLNKNTRYVAGSKVGDVLLQYMQLKGMGWNIFSSVTNVIFGWFSNFNYAAGGTEFTAGEMLQANKMMLAATGRGVGLDSALGRKINALMIKFDVLKELNDASYRPTTNTNRVKKGLENLSPYELQRRGEYFVQGMTLLASMLHQKVTINGETVTLFDAFDENGDYKDKTDKDWGGDVNDKSANRKLFAFKFKLDQVNKSIHGNYDTNSPVRIKKGIAGRAVMQFRSWIAEGVASRLEGKKYDLLLGRHREGRWRTYADLGFKESLKALLAIARGKEGDLVIDDAQRELVISNMKRNLSELYQTLTLLGLYYALKLIDFDDDDEWNKKAANFTLNQILRLQDDIEFYYSPLAVENITQNFIPVFTLVRDGAKFVDSIQDGIVRGEWDYKTGKKAGESKVLWTGVKLFPFGSSMASFINKTENEENFRK